MVLYYAATWPDNLMEQHKRGWNFIEIYFVVAQQDWQAEAQWNTGGIKQNEYNIWPPIENESHENFPENLKLNLRRILGVLKKKTKHSGELNHVIGNIETNSDTRRRALLYSSGQTHYSIQLKIQH